MTGERTHVEVWLRGVPLRLRARTVEYEQDLLRELALVRLSADLDGSTGAPARLLALADEIRSTLGGMTAGPDAQMEAALDRGEDVLDVVYSVPIALTSVLHRVEEVLAEVDRFCREGRYLLTLAAPADVTAFRRWQFAEFYRQIEGGAPIPWSRSPESRMVTSDA